MTPAIAAIAAVIPSCAANKTAVNMNTAKPSVKKNMYLGLPLAVASEPIGLVIERIAK